MLDPAKQERYNQSLTDFSSGQRKYDYDYYTGSQVSVFIGDIWIDDCFRIQWNQLEKIRPVFGCNSRFMDTVVGGQVMVEGRFAINFKEKAYIPIILDHYKNTQQSLPITKNKLGEGHGYLTDKEDQKLNVPLNIERMMRLMSEESGKNLAYAEDQLFNAIHWTDDWAFEDEAEGLEDLLWGSSGKGGPVVDSILDRPIVPVPFDIYILYGDYSQTSGNKVNHTAIKLEGCVIAGESQTIEANGQPIIEVYEFIARKKK